MSGISYNGPVELSTLIDVAAGRRPADLVLRNGQVVNVFTGEVLPADVAIVGDRIAGIGDYKGRETIDLSGRFLCPGFIDAHVHIESSMLSVPEFARVVAARGTTAVVADPHEFANVMGTEGIRYVLRTAKNAPIDVYVMLSSCVPASPLEGAGAELSAIDLLPFFSDPWVRGLAEMMNYPGVVSGNEDVLDKIRIAGERVIDGHAPGLSGKPLAAYVASGIASDHECIGVDEAREKLRLGMYIMIREGSQTRNLEALLPLVTPANATRFMFCTDDKVVEDLLVEGHVDHIVRRAVNLGLDPASAVRIASYNTARYFGLPQTGAVAPGYRADLAVIDDWQSCRVSMTFRNGQMMARDGRCVHEQPAPASPLLRSSINVEWLKPEHFVIPAPDGRTPRVHVIEAIENRIDTRRTIEPARVKDGRIVADVQRDLCKLAVIERHRASGEIGLALVRGFGLQRGALASSVAHDAHNLIVVGVDDADLLAAAVHIVKTHGGLCAVEGGNVIADLPLPIAGLVSPAPAETVAEQHRRLLAAAASLGCRLQQPFMALSFLSLSVIGKLKLTNQGLVDVDQFRLIPLIAD
jgi:adenine deaminase